MLPLLQPLGTKALSPCPERDHDDSNHDEYDAETSSYEDESISDEEESYISYNSLDQLTVIVEETDQDLLEEMSIRGSTSCRSRHESFKLIEDFPPSPPVRRWIEGLDAKNHNTMEAIAQSPQTSSCRTSTTSNMTLSSQSTTTTDNRVPPPFTFSGNSRISNASEIQSWDEEYHDYDDDDDHSSCWSEPLNGQPSTCRRGELKFGTRQHGDMDESLQGSSYITLSLQGSSLVSFQNGEGTYFAPPSDDEYTFVSCTTGDDMSVVSDIGSSRHARTVDSLDDIEGDTIPQSTDQQQSSSINEAGQVGSSLNRRLSSLSIDGDLLSPIPEGDSSDDENPTILQQPLNYQLVQNKLMSQIQSSLAKVFEGETLLLDGSNTASSHRLIALKRRLQLERYGGMRRRRTFERAKTVIGKKLKHPVAMLHHYEDSPTPIFHDHYSAAIVPRLDDNLARFGGSTRRESFHRNKSTFEKKFDKDIKPRPISRRHSLSSVQREESCIDMAEFHLQMSKSESQLIVDMDEVIDQLQELGKKRTCQNEDSELEEKFKMRQERFGGLGRRKSFNRSRRFLIKKFERIQARSLGDKERFGGLQRMASYKQSRKQLENSSRGSRNTRSLGNASESSRATHVTSEHEVFETHIGKTSMDVNGRKIIATLCASACRIPCTSLRQI